MSLTIFFRWNNLCEDEDDGEEEEDPTEGGHQVDPPERKQNELTVMVIL